MTLCTSCKNFIDITSKCKATKGKQEPVRGFDIELPISAWAARTTELYCGVDAKWFKPKGAQ